jgi:hypothetical protein
MATGHESNQQPGTTQNAAGGQTGQEWDALKGGVGEMADAAMEQGRHILDSAREQATGYVDQRKDDLAQSVVGLARTLRDSGGAFDQPSIRAIVESAAGGLEQLADNIRSRSFGTIIDDVEGMVRRRPAAAAIATMATGFLLARFVKASAEGLRGTGAQAGRQSAGAGQPGRQSGAGGQWQPHGMTGSNRPPGQAGT